MAAALDRRVATLLAMTIPAPRVSGLMDFRVRRPRGALEKTEVAPLVGLADMVREQPPVAARIAGRRRPPGRAALFELPVAHVQAQAPAGNVEFDHVAVAHQ